MKSFYFLLKNYSFIYVMYIAFVISSCSSKKNFKDINIVKAPEWVRSSDVNGFSSVGIAKFNILEKNEYGEIEEINLSLSEANIRAKKNALSNLKLNLLVYLENFFLDETLDISNSKKNFIVYTLNNISKSILTDTFVSNISIQDEMWRSPTDEVLYVRFFADKKLLSSTLAQKIDELQQKYSYDDELFNLMIKIKNDILYNGLKSGSKYIRKIKQQLSSNSNGSVKKHGDVIISNVILTKDEKQNEAKEYFDLNKDGVVDEKEIEQRINEDWKKNKDN